MKKNLKPYKGLVTTQTVSEIYFMAENDKHAQDMLENLDVSSEKEEITSSSREAVRATDVRPTQYVIIDDYTCIPFKAYMAFANKLEPTEGYALILGCIGGNDEVGGRGDDERPIIYTDKLDASKEVAEIIQYEHEKFLDVSNPSYSDEERATLDISEITIDHYIGWCVKDGDIYTYFEDNRDGLELFSYDYSKDEYAW